MQNMTKKDYIEFRKIFARLTDVDELYDIINAHDGEPFRKRQLILNRISIFKKEHGNPTTQLRKHQNDFAIYMQLTYDHN